MYTETILGQDLRSDEKSRTIMSRNTHEMRQRGTDTYQSNGPTTFMVSASNIDERHLTLS